MFSIFARNLCYWWLIVTAFCILAYKVVQLERVTYTEALGHSPSCIFTELVLYCPSGRVRESYIYWSSLCLNKVQFNWTWMTIGTYISVGSSLESEKWEWRLRLLVSESMVRFGDRLKLVRWQRSVSCRWSDDTSIAGGQNDYTHGW